jgi:arginine decarboxylase
MKSANSGESSTLSLGFGAAADRNDQWRHLNAAARAWAAAGAKEAGARKTEAAKLWNEVRGLEHFHAYPGPRLLDAVSAAAGGTDGAEFARLVQKVSAALLSGDYRRDEHVWDPDAESEGRMLDTLPPDVVGGPIGKPWFEVLIVTPTPTAEWSRSREEIGRMRREDDPFN